MYIEDLVEELSKLQKVVNSADMAILQSFTNQYYDSTGFTEKQSVLALRILTRYEKSLSYKLKTDISEFLKTPDFKLKIKKSVSTKTVRIVDEKTIEVKFPFNEEILQTIRDFKAKDRYSTRIAWDKDSTSWRFDLTEQTLRFVMDLCDPIKFELDETFRKYSDDIESVINHIENYAPTLVIDNGELIITNPTKNMPKIDTDSILAAVFQARNMGVSLWDDNINCFLNSEFVLPEIKKFLSNDIAKEYHIENNECGISVIKTIIEHTGPALIIIPAGSEYIKLKQMFDILKDIDVQEKNMSVLFRLPAETGQIFNDFVKNQAINGPISSETKVVFISTKLPKPLLKSGLKFDTVINMGYVMAHYTLKEFTKNHQNFINFGNKTKNTGFNFAKL